MPPTSTYRLQLRREFGFRDAAAVVPYLAALGVSHVYCSPVLTATPGSAHGYDVVDHTRLSPELGGNEGWHDLVAACRAHGLGIVVDVVPNHMAVPVPERDNVPLWDVLRHGEASAYRSWFDIDWATQGGRVLLPVLGAPLEDAIAAGEITVDVAAGEVRYYDHRFPLAPGTEELVDDLPALLDAQHYRLAFWRTAATELNYRRFFDVTTLIGVRVEDPQVFDATHARLLALVADGEVDGLRIDHPDGLADPGGYLDRLAKASHGTWTVVEKILEHGERLPPAWACAGTTGYDTITALQQLFLDPAGAAPLTRFYGELTGDETDYAAVAAAAKRQVVEQLFGAEVDRLVRELEPVRASTLDVPAPADARAAVVELLVAFDVYRAYLDDPSSADRVQAAADRASAAAPEHAAAVRAVAAVVADPPPEAAGFATRFAQTTGPVMAKGVEDTAFYRYLRLTALNEVGADPGVFGQSVDAWHAHCRQLAERSPQTMTTLSTHDTKRSEDVRARLLVLAEIPDEWAAAVNRWREAARRHGPPDAATDYLIWQTLVGAWPLSAERLTGYLAKATHEAKRATSWTDPDERYDAALAAYAEAVLADESLTEDVGGWVDAHVRRAGWSNSLAQKLVQLTMPGVPDVYQGQELTDLSLVDPDNRRPVDYDRRRDELDNLDTGAADVSAKLRVTATALRLRRRRPGLFRSGAYEPVSATGAAAGHVVAFRRRSDVDEAMTVVTRLPVGLRQAGGWGDTELELPDGYVDALTGRPAVARLADLLAELPVALLVRNDG